MQIGGRRSPCKLENVVIVLLISGMTLVTHKSCGREAVGPSNATIEF